MAITPMSRLARSNLGERYDQSTYWLLLSLSLLYGYYYYYQVVVVVVVVVVVAVSLSMLSSTLLFTIMIILLSLPRRPLQWVGFAYARCAIHDFMRSGTWRKGAHDCAGLYAKGNDPLPKPLLRRRRIWISEGSTRADS